MTAPRPTVPVSGHVHDDLIWRVLGDPLLPPSADGPLSGETVAVKDVFAVAGHRTGAGNPARLDLASPEPEHAAAVQRLLDAGAALQGIARTDEFAYSLAGQNHHYGTPPNPLAPGRIPGGSSSGSATAVSLGRASIGLGTDTGGSIRVPGAYQGLYGIRTTHGAIDRNGLLPLAPAFDTVGWLTRSAALLRAVGDVLLPESATPRCTDHTFVVVPGLLQLAEPGVVAAVTKWAPADTVVESWPLQRLGDWSAVFQIWQAHQAWQAHGAWLCDRLDTLGADVRRRFERASRIVPEAAAAAERTAAEISRVVRDLLGDRILVLPSAASVAPLPEQAQARREATMRLTSLAGLAGLPAVTVPTGAADRLPVGVGLVAAPGRDHDLLAVAAELADAPGAANP